MVYASPAPYRHPFHCWPYARLPSLLHSLGEREAREVSESLLYSRFTVGQFSAFPSFFPFHCWAVLSFLLTHPFHCWALPPLPLTHPFHCWFCTKGGCSRSVKGGCSRGGGRLLSGWWEGLSGCEGGLSGCERGSQDPREEGYHSPPVYPPHPP